MDILVVVDMQKDFISGALGTKEAVGIVPRVAEKIVQAKKACRIICCGLYRRDGIDSLPDGKTDIIVQMPEPEQVVRMPVITAKHAAIGAAALKQRHKR